MQPVPALLTNSTEEFIQQFNSFVPYFKRFSIDIIDGEFANNLTLQVPQLIEIITGNKLHLSPDVIFDFDLMVNDYQTRINDIEKLKKNVRVENVVIYAKPLAGKPIPSKDDINIGLSFTPNDSVDDLSHIYNLQDLSVAQIMTIVPGFQGQSFIPEELNKIQQLRELGYRNKIFIDGSVNDTTIPTIISKKYKPDFLCIGSFLTKATNLSQRVEYLNATLKI